MKHLLTRSARVLRSTCPHKGHLLRISWQVGTSKPGLPPWQRPQLARFQHTNHWPSGRVEIPQLNDTIYALSTAQGRAAIAVIRISGSACLDIYRALCPKAAIPKPRTVAIRSLHHPGQPKSAPVVLDSEALVLYFPSPKTVTGEDVLELHVHGGTATVKAVLSAIPQCPKPAGHLIRYAEPGEFTKRAFFNDRLDLTQIESLSDTLAAETEQQRRAAVRGDHRNLGKTYEDWRHQLLLARGELEAFIDFSEEHHFDESNSELLKSVTEQVSRIVRDIRLYELGGQKRELLRNGIRIALLGPPNAGKSSLMNLIVGREASIVSGEAGTTRDIIEASLDIGGYLCSFADTAGFRSTDASAQLQEQIGAVEREGIRRAEEKARQSDIVMVLASVETKDGVPSIHFDQGTLHLGCQADMSLLVVNKTDGVDPDTLARLVQDFRTHIRQTAHSLSQAPLLTISCKEAASLPAIDGQDAGSLQSLTSTLTTTFTSMTTMPEDMQDLLGVSERQRQLLAQCRAWLEEFMMESQPGEGEADSDPVVVAECLRYAADRLARLTGKGEAGDVEEVLGVVFEKFCVGK